MLAQRCRVCGSFFEARSGTLCPGCEAVDVQPDHHRSDRVGMRAVALSARVDGSVVCWLCESRVPPAGYDGVWSADHSGSGLRPAHRGCNSARGARSVSWFRERLELVHPGWFDSVRGE